MTKSIELRLYEAAALIEWFERALALERGAGTPVTSREYLAHRSDALTWLRNNKPA